MQSVMERVYVAAIFLPFYHIFTHIHDMVLIYALRCNPFNLLSSGLLYLAIHALVYELPVEITPRFLKS